MTQEEKELLLKDLCARLPYQPICQFTDTEDDFCTATAALGYSLRDFIAGKVLIKPYLRPMSSMTKDEINEYENFIKNENDDQLRFCNELVFYNRHHFDYRGLIPRGLALEAPEGMYNIPFHGKNR